MGKHRAAGQVSRPLVALVAATGLLAVAGLVTAGNPASHRSIAFVDPSCGRPVRVVAATSFVPVLTALAAEPGDRCARLTVTAADGRTAAGEAARAGTDVWIPDDRSWAVSARSLPLAKAPAAGAGTVLATSPLYMVTDRPTGDRLAENGGSWAALARMIDGVAGQRLVIRDPAGSGDGVLAAAAVAEAVWLDEDMDASALWLSRARARTRIVAGDEPALPVRPGEVGLVPEYALPAEVGAPGGSTVAVPGADHTAMLRFTWYPLAEAAADPVRAAALGRLLQDLTGPAAAPRLAAARLRTPSLEQAPPGGVLPDPRAAPFEPFLPHHIDHVFATWYADARRTNLLIVVDVSGSMAAAVSGGSGASRIDLVRQGARSLGGLLPDDSSLGLWEFGSELDGSKDYRVLVGMAPLNPAHRRTLSAAIDRLDVRRTGTGLYDTILAAYRAAQASHRSDVPTQVLIFTDGRNESDDDSLTAGQLAARLHAAADPRRPVALNVVTFGSRLDAKVVRAALTPVKGYVDVLTTADEVAAAFIHVAAGDLRH